MVNTNQYIKDRMDAEKIKEVIKDMCEIQDEYLEVDGKRCLYSDILKCSIQNEDAVGVTEKKEDLKLYLERVIKNIGKIEAQGTITSEGFIVLKGSQISPVDDSTVPDTIKEQRRTSNIVDGILQDDMLFSSPSGAAMFVVGKSDNGLTRWKDENGRTLKEIENCEIMNENQYFVSRR